MEGERAELLVVADKVDWKGRKAYKYKHGGMRVVVLILGNFNLTKISIVFSF